MADVVRREDLEEVAEKLKKIAERMGLPFGLLLAEEFADELGRRVGEAVSEGVKVPRPVSRVLDLRNRLIEGPSELLYSRCRGKLNEFVLKAEGKNFELLIETDNVPRLHMSYDELANLSPHSQFVDAFQELDENGQPTGRYVVRLGEMGWLTTCSITVYPRGSLRLAHVYAKWDEYM
ncbi:MAG: hypothetical protein DRP11_03610 [Candidatus Aenigmatarchaeota archaeon]|nr:MAG: hypothetical protein DRP11_03610 [Candidatus Aenigmarchaeota archaeon]